ncbi:MAG: SMP-30/gluconolactonase/LRE family protein [Chloroflexota bacterium]
MEHGLKVVAEGMQFPESPRWSDRDGCLYLVDWTADRVLKVKNNRLETCFELPGGGPSGLCQDAQGNLWLCLYSGRKLAAYTPQGKLLGKWADCQATPFKGPCDLVCDRGGGVYFTDSGNFEEDWRSGRAAGAIYHLASKDSQPRCLTRSLHFPNGIALSNDGTYLYVNEHRRNRTLRYSVAEDGSLRERQEFFVYDHECLLALHEAFELGPDGMCVDDQDNLFVAHYGAGKVLHLSPQGDLLQVIHLPRGRRPTSVAYHTDEQAIFITEAEFGLLYRFCLAG